MRIKKQLTITIACLIIIAVLVIPFSANAQWQALKDAVDNLGVTIVSHVMGAFVYLSAGFAQIAGSLLDWVVSPEFISFSYTNPSGDNANPIVAAGLDITKNFVNLGLVVVLIFIAISISLQLKEYASQKTFLRLFVVALLVNFAPVICGVIVDASNITMNFFLQGIRNDISGALTDVSNESLAGALTRPGTLKPFSLLVKGAIMMGLYFSIGLAFLLMVFVFVLRYIMIWLLVILSPLAFVAWILPATKKVWDMWWKQLIQWSIIGIPMAFFLYLAATAIPVIKGRFESQVKIPGAEASIVGLVDQSFPYFVIAAFIYLGFFIGLKATAFGSSSAIRAAQWSRKRATGAIGWGAKEGARKVGRGARPVLERKLRSAAAKTGRFTRRIGNWDPTGTGIKPLAAFKWATPKAVSDFGNLRPAIDAAAKEAEGESGLETADKILTQKVKGAQAMGYYSKLLKGNDAQDLFNRARSFSRWKGLSDEEIVNDKQFGKVMAPLLKNAGDTGMLGSTLRRDPRLAKIAAKYGIGSYKGMSPEMAVSKATNEAREHIKDWEPEELKDKDQLRSVLANFEEDRMLQLNRQVKNGQKTFHESMDGDFSGFARNHSTIKNSGFSESEITELLSDRTDKDGNAVESETFKEIWKDYEKETEQKYGGNAGFKALNSKRVQDRGYRRARYVEEKPTTTTPSSPAIGLGMGPLGIGTQPPKVTVKPTPTTGSREKGATKIPTTGAGGSKKRETPTTGTGTKK